MNAYAGESIAKKVCRVRLYRRVRATLKGWSPKAAPSAIVLPGPDASEVGALKHVLGLCPESVVAVDRCPVACAAIARRWPGVKTITGDLADFDVLAEAKRLLPDGLGATFIHLDLMGNLSNAAFATYSRWIQVLHVNGVVAVTYLRGREGPSSIGAQRRTEMMELSEEVRALTKHPGHGSLMRGFLRVLSADFDRAASHLGALNEALAAVLAARGAVLPKWSSTNHWKNGFEMGMAMGLWWTAIASHAYRAETSPMGVVAAQLTRDVLPSRLAFVQQRSRDTSSVIRKDPMDDLLAEADSLNKEFSNAEVAEILNVAPSTLAAWRAHRTMGTYA